MTSNIQISWDGGFALPEQNNIRQALNRAVFAHQVPLCACGINLILISRGHRSLSFVAAVWCGCGQKIDEPFEGNLAAA